MDTLQNKPYSAVQNDLESMQNNTQQLHSYSTNGPPAQAIMQQPSAPQTQAQIPITFIPHNIPVGPSSLETQCPQCRCRIKTRVTHRSTSKTHLACLLLMCTGCCCLPYCMNTCRNANHFCPMCGAFIGTYQS